MPDTGHGVQATAAPNFRLDAFDYQVLGVDIAVPNFSTLSRRSDGLSLPARFVSKSEMPVQLAVDSAGLKIFGAASDSRNGIKPSTNGAPGASCTSASIW